MKVINIMSRIQKMFLGVSLLLINDICLAENVNNSTVKYYRWAMIERQDRKPIFSATTTLKHIYSPNTEHEKNYYKVTYKNDIIKKVLTYVKDKLIRIDSFDKNGTWLSYLKYEGANEIKCDVRLETLEKSKSVLTSNCDNNSGKQITYIYKEWNKEQKNILEQDVNKTIFYWTIYETVEYKNNKRIFKQIVKDSTCFSYDNNDTLINQGHCSSYEHTMPMDHANWSIVPMW